MRKLTWFALLIFLVVVMYVPSRFTPRQLGEMAIAENVRMEATLPSMLTSTFVSVSEGLFNVLDGIVAFPRLWQLDPNLSEADRQAIREKDDFALMGEKADRISREAYFQSMYALWLFALQRGAWLFVILLSLIPIIGALLLDACVVRRRRIVLVRSPKPIIWRTGWNALWFIAIYMPSQLFVPGISIWLLLLQTLIIIGMLYVMVIYSYKAL